MDFKTMAKMDRLAAVLRYGVDVRFWDCCSGSDQSPENSADLSDLVNSFIERDDNVERHEQESQEEEKKQNNIESDSYSFDSETGNKLRNLFGSRENKTHDINSKEAIQVEAEHALQHLVGGGSLQLPVFKRQLMAHLRIKGFDAGLCKSKREQCRPFPAGDHEYIDVNIDGNRYFVEIFLAREFEIARPTSQYKSLLNIFPEIFVGNLEDLKQIVRLMCSAIKESMKRKDMHLPPWRRNGYMQAKWLGSYRRTTNDAPTQQVSETDKTSPEKVSACFKGFPAKAYHCRGDFGRNGGLKVGYLAAAFGHNGLLL